MQIIKMKLADFESVYELWEAAGTLLAPKNVELYEYKRMITLNPTSSLMIKENDKIIGAGIGAFNGKRAWIYHLAIHPDYQKQGLGKLLLQKIEKELTKVGATKIVLEVSTQKLYNVSFYEKSGFNVTNDTIHLEKSLLKTDIINS